jgi:hypothetical protein
MGPWRWLAARSTGWTGLANFRQPPLIFTAALVPAAFRSTIVGTNHGEVSPKSVRSMPGSTRSLASSRLPASFDAVMDHHPKFEGFRFIGDKRTQLVYDLTTWDDDATINDIADAGVGLGFGPDTLAEARNRGYTLAAPGIKRRHRKPRA